MNRVDRNIMAFAVGALLITFTVLAFAGGKKEPPPEPPPLQQDQEQNQGQAQGQHQGQAQGQEQGQEQATSVEVDAMSLSDSNSFNEGNNTEINSRTENNSSNVVLVPNNNTEPCLRIWGLSFGKDGTAAALGVPWRSAACDLEQAADDAFAGGERDLGWFWKCKSKNLYKQFKPKGVSVEAAQGACLNKMLGGVSQSALIKDLRGRIELLLTERVIDREECNEAKDRIVEGCYK